MVVENAIPKSQVSFGLVKKLTLMLLGAILAVSIAIMSANAIEDFHEGDVSAKETVERNMRVAWNELHHYGTNFHSENGELSVGDTKLNDKNEIADAVVALVGGNATIFSGDTRVATNVKNADGSRAVGTKLAKNSAFEAVFAGKNYRGETDILGKRYITAYDPIKDSSGQVVGVLFVGEPLEQFYAPLYSTIYRSLMFGALTCSVVLLVVGTHMRRVVTEPIARLTAVMHRLAVGDLTVEIPDYDRRDEIKEIENALVVFKKNELEELRLEKEQKATHEEQVKRVRVVADLTARFESDVFKVVKDVSASAKEMQKMSHEMTQIAEGTKEQATSVSAAATEASANVETVAAATEELSASVGEIGRHVEEAAKVSQQAAEQTQKTERMFEKLAASSIKIGEVITLINEIASQTNLLALNATIEAARAGEAGKGFAVVASEVKNLAGQTAKATDEISSQVAEVQSETKNAVAAVRAISSVIDRVRDISASIAAAVEQQEAATKEIARNVQEAAQGTRAVSENIVAVNAEATRTGTGAEEVHKAAGELAHDAGLLHKEVEAYITKIRS